MKIIRRKQKMTTSKTHLGQIIKARAKELRMGATELGNLVGTSKQNVYGIFKRSSMDSALIFQLSLALNLDLFAPYSDELGMQRGQEQTIAEEVIQLRKEIGYLKTIIRIAGIEIPSDSGQTSPQLEDKSKIKSIK